MPGTEQKEPVQKKEKKMTGVGFYIVLIFAIAKDLSDLLFNLTAVLSPLTTMTGLLMGAVLFCYFFFVGVTPDMRKVATFVSSSIIDAMPFLSFLPMTTINLIVIRYLENKTS